MDSLIIAVSIDLDIMLCEYCQVNKKSFGFNGYCHHIERLGGLKWGIKWVNNVYKPYIDKRRLDNTLSRMKRGIFDRWKK